MSRNYEFKFGNITTRVSFASAVNPKEVLVFAQQRVCVLTVLCPL